MTGVNQGGKDAMSNCAMCTLAAALRCGGDGKTQQQAVLNALFHEVERMLVNTVKGYQFSFPGHCKSLVEVRGEAVEQQRLPAAR